MRQSTLLRFIALSLLFASVLGVISFYALRAFNESSSSEVRRHLVHVLAQRIESGPYAETVVGVGSRPERHLRDMTLWVLSSEGTVLASNSGPLPVSWASLSKPGEVHEFSSHFSGLSLVADFTLVKLDDPKGAFLLFGTRRHGPMSGWWMQIALLMSMLGVAALLAVGLAYGYLIRRSAEARAVLARLEAGDLKARFEIGRLDEIGSLMVDFNRMAAEIEHLVNRVAKTESARRDLLEELSHDLRTPLTSLRASAEALSEHFDEMGESDKKEFIGIIRSQLGYFLHLIEDLFFIADLAEPRYKKTTAHVELRGLLEDEIAWRRSQNKGVAWELEGGKQAITSGDPMLLQRLLKNALDNAAKFAVKRVLVKIGESGTCHEVVIEDDGAGISDAEIERFGARANFRPSTRGSDPEISLGLGSVIMKSIVELHGGTLRIERSTSGTRLTLSLTRDLAAQLSSTMR